MPGALLSYLGGWWARWFPRAGGELVPEPEPASEPVPAAVPAASTAAPAPAQIDGAERAFLETVRMEARRAARAPAAPAAPDPRVRTGTLEALEGLRQIPALQSLVQGVTRIMSREGVALDEVAEALQKDSSLCVRVLTMANSAAVAPELRIDDLQSAVQMLGIARVRRVAQAVFTLRDAQRVTEGLDWRHLWIHALATAAIAEELDRRLRPVPSSQVYMAGLLHDVGKIALSTVAADAYRDVIVSSWNGEGRLEDLERQRLGVDHREAGVIFARGNRLSDVVVSVIGHHDDPSLAEQHRFEVALVSVANFISKARGLGFSGARLDMSDGELEELPAWGIFEEETGYLPDAAQLEREMAAFFGTLRDDLRGMHE